MFASVHTHARNRADWGLRRSLRSATLGAHAYAAQAAPRRTVQKLETPLIAVTKPKDKKEVRILIADDHELIRRAVRQLLEHESGLMVCGEAANGKQAVEYCQRLQPEVAILDISMPVMNGLDAAEEIKRLSPTTKIVILTMHNLEEVRNEVCRVGIDGYVAKTDACANLVKLIQSFFGLA